MDARVADNSFDAKVGGTRGLHHPGGGGVGWERVHHLVLVDGVALLCANCLFLLTSEVQLETGGSEPIRF